jgi:hypothetical protein
MSKMRVKGHEPNPAQGIRLSRHAPYRIYEKIEVRDI